MSAQLNSVAPERQPGNPAASLGVNPQKNASGPGSQQPKGLFSTILMMLGNNTPPMAPGEQGTAGEPGTAQTPANAPGKPFTGNQSWLDFSKPDLTLSLSAQTLEIAQGEQGFPAGLDIAGIQSPMLQLAGMAEISDIDLPDISIADISLADSELANNVPVGNISTLASPLAATLAPTDTPVPATAASTTPAPNALAANGANGANGDNTSLPVPIPGATPALVASANPNPAPGGLPEAPALPGNVANLTGLPVPGEPQSTNGNQIATNQTQPQTLTQNGAPLLEFVASTATRTALSASSQQATTTDSPASQLPANIQTMQNEAIRTAQAQIQLQTQNPGATPSLEFVASTAARTDLPVTPVLAQQVASLPQNNLPPQAGKEAQKPDLAAELQRLLSPSDQRALSTAPAGIKPPATFTPGGNEPNFPGTALPGPNTSSIAPALLLAGLSGNQSANGAPLGSPLGSLLVDPLLQAQTATSANLPGQISPTGPLSPALASTAQNAYQQPQINLPAVAFQIVRNFSNGINRFQIRIDPPELGRIDVRLNVDDKGSLTARLTVERPETLDLLQRDARALERALGQAGFEGSRTNLEFSLKQNPFGGDTNQNNPDQLSAQNEPADEAAQDQVGTITPPNHTLARPGGLSLWA